jgi:hypothetical protein
VATPVSRGFYLEKSKVNCTARFKEAADKNVWTAKKVKIFGLENR